MTKLELVFVLTQDTFLLRGLILKPTKRTKKKRILGIAGNFELFQCFNFETSYLKNWKLFSKKKEYNVLVESTKIENNISKQTYPVRSQC